MFPIGTIPGRVTWATNNGNVDASGLPGHTETDNSAGRVAPTNVTNVLTVTNVNINNNGRDYICAQGVVNPVLSNKSFLTMLGE